ncbi:MAG: M16 family metallopeptidase [Phycisphaerales bacterium JB039]
MEQTFSRTLACGAQLALEPMAQVRSAAVTCLLPVGAASDPEGRAGLATVLSEMILRGAGDRDSRALADALDGLGANRSATAGSQTMRIGATCVSDQLGAVLEALADIICSPRFAEADMEPVRDLALQDLRSLLDEPRERAFLAARRRHLPAPLNQPTEGDEPGLRAISIDDVRGHWQARARPGGAFIGVAGAIDPDDIAGRLDRLLEGWHGAAAPLAPGAAPVRGYAHEEDDSNQAQIVIMADAPPEPSPDSALERLACAVLSGGMSGRLFTEVREKRGLCYEVSAAYTADCDFGVLSAYVGTTPERAQQSLDVVLAELRRIWDPAGAVTAEELARARAGLLSRLVFSGESTGARAAGLASDLRRLGRARALEEIADRIRAVTLEELNAYLARRLDGVLTIQTLGPAPLTAPA